MRLLAPAKINLHLRVGPPRADGFHPLLTWMATVRLFDILELDRCGESGMHLECDQADVPCGAGNLVTQAAAVLVESLQEGRQLSSIGGTGLQVRLHKRIPVGAGLGGGSSDGACILMGLNRLWRLGWEVDRLASLGARLGSDVPFFFHAPSAICRGRGEIVRPMAPPRPRWALLVLPGRGLSTPAAYRRFDEMELGGQTTIEAEPDFVAWTTLDAGSLLEQLVNDLEPAAFSIDPDLGALRLRLEQMLSRRVRMSGSGSSLFTLFDTSDEAEEARRVVAQNMSIQALVVELCPNPAEGLNAEGSSAVSGVDRKIGGNIG
jgi:4-diphosphocytidyl-2-C-methyl-D-erythritol kinase